MLGSVKKKIEESIKLATKDMGVPVRSKKLLADVCFTMYKSGLVDGHSICIRTLEISKKQLEKEKQ